MKKNILFMTNSQKALHFLIEHPVRNFLEKEIQKATKVSKSGINYALRDLVSAGYISRNKRGKSFFYTLNHNNLIVKQLKIIQTIKQLEGILKKLQPASLKIILFGSSSRGENTPDSDVDLVIITRNKNLATEVIKKYKNRRKIQSVICSNLEFLEKKKTDPVFYDQVNKGIVLWEGDMNEL